MRFTDPWYGLLAIPIVLGLIFSWRHVHGLARPRKVLAFGLRSLLAGLITLCLMGPQSIRPNEGLTTIFVLDRSDSISDEDKRRSLEFVEKAIAEMGSEDQAGIVVFGAQPAIESAVGGKRHLRKITSAIDPSGSNLASAIRVAAASFPEGKAKRIVIVSDGNETTGDAVQAIEVASQNDITVDYLPLGSGERRPEASILDLQAPSERSSEEPFDVRVVVESSIAQEGVLILDRDGEVVSRTRVKLQEGRNSFVIPQRLTDSGFFRYRAYLEVPRDADDRNNIGSSFVSVKGKPRVLLVQGDPGKQELYRALTEQGIAVTLAGGDGMPTRPEDLQPYNALILNDFDASLTTPNQAALVRAAVRDTGIGFAMIGGEGSFLPGGWYGSPIADVLPVDLNVRQRQDFPSTTVYIVMDTSGSMMMTEGGVTKLQLAAMAAIETLKLLSPQDYLGVAGSGSYVEEVAPIQQAKNKDEIIRNIRKLGPGGGGIYIGTSVAYAKQKLAHVDTRVRHLIILADGDDAELPENSLADLREMHQQKITTSVVAIGTGKDIPLLKSLAVAGGGNYYLAKEANKLPAIFTQDVALMSRSAIEEGAFYPKLVSGDEILDGLAEFPVLTAYCLTDARPLSRVIMRTQKDDPLLATWQFGLGTSLAFTSDAQNRWAKAWVGWDGFSRFWAQAVRSLSRKSTLNDYAVEVNQEETKGLISITAKDAGGNPLQDPNLLVKVSTPTGETTDVSLIQEAPGKYSGTFAAPDVGSYIVSIAEKGGKGETRVSTSGFSVSYPPEYRAYRTNKPLLSQAAEIGNGKELKDPAEAMREVADPGTAIKDLWTWFLLASILILPLDIAVRRVVIPLPQWSQLFSKRAKAPAQSETTERLRSAKVRAQTKSTPAADRKVEIPVSKGTPQGFPEPEDPVEEVKEPTTVSAASRLLEARRSRDSRKPKR